MTAFLFYSNLYIGICLNVANKTLVQLAAIVRHVFHSQIHGQRLLGLVLGKPMLEVIVANTFLEVKIVSEKMVTVLLILHISLSVLAE